MEHPDYNSPSALKDFLETNNMGMQKKFGQNFMINPDARKKIIDALHVEKDMEVWEIGPGLGCMTNELLEHETKVTVFEIDRGFVSMLNQFFKKQIDDNNLTIIQGDVLKSWKKQYELTPQTKRLTGNLPYNIAATFIADTITSGIIFDSCVFTVQKEVADRMIALPGTENYSSFSVLCQWMYNVKSLFTLAPGNFWPRPNVASAAVSFERKQKPYSCSNPSLFVTLVHTLFASRRKTVYNNIKPLVPQGIDSKQWFANAGIEPSERAEDIPLDKLLELSQIISSDILKK